LRFQNKKIPWKTTLATIMSNTALSGNLSKTVAYANVSNFMLLRKFNVRMHPPKAPKVIEVICQPPFQTGPNAILMNQPMEISHLVGEFSEITTLSSCFVLVKTLD
jgi:hypothetical protein